MSRITLLLLGILASCASKDQETTPTDSAIDGALDSLDADSVTVDAPPDWHPEAPFTITLDSYPRVDGATATLPLDMIVACELLGVRWHWTTGSGEGGWESYVQPEGALADGLTTKIVHHKTDQAWKNLVDGSADLIFQASLPNADTLAYATSKGVTLEPKPIALDALVFLLHPTNPVDALSVDQIVSIYTGVFTRWDQVSGLARDIHPYTRPKESGSFELFDELVLKGRPTPTWPPDLVPIFMGAMIYKVSTDPDSIGYSVYYYVRYIVPGLATGTKIARIGGIDATSATIASREYPLTTQTYVVTRTDLDPASTARRLRDWLLGPDGQRVVKMTGYVPVTPGG